MILQLSAVSQAFFRSMSAIRSATANISSNILRSNCFVLMICLSFILPPVYCVESHNATCIDAPSIYLYFLVRGQGGEPWPDSHAVRQINRGCAKSSWLASRFKTRSPSFPWWWMHCHREGSGDGFSSRERKKQFSR